MPLKPESQLIWSPTVVNSRMNRSRNASGVNSYEKEFGFRPEDFLMSVMQSRGSASWLDLCCGHGKALLQVKHYFDKQHLGDRLHLKGIDLVDTFDSYDKNAPGLTFEVNSLITWEPDTSYDLITCVHGLHYVGDKVFVIEKAAKALSATGLFIANLDDQHIVVEGVQSKSYLKKMFAQHGFEFNPRRKILKRVGVRDIHFGLQYQGADDEVGPNYTGQEAVASYYMLSPTE